jgi:hypothetical protein
MFPYRRNGGKKRGKGGPPGPHQQQPQHRHRDHGNGGGPNGRRVPGSAGEVLSMLQPTTKALAQMLAGNSRVSGQLAHARNVMVHAHRLVEERAVDRLPPAQREEFLEQLARLKLTLTDAEEAAEAAEFAPAAEPRSAAVELGPDRLREVARRLAISSNQVTPPPPLAVPVGDAEPEPEEEPEPEREIPAATAARGERIRLRLSPDADGPAPVRARDRVRLKPVAKPAVGPSSSGG